MIEFITHIASVFFTAIVIVIIVLLINRIERKKHGEYHVTYEYKFFKFRYREILKMIEELDALGQDGWEVASFVGEDSFYAFLILKRETLHTSKTEK